MSIKFFGQFLLERGVLNNEQLLEAVSYQESRNRKFGQYAQSKGFLSAEDVEKLNHEQKTTDLRIGELAVKLGMIEPSQVEEILTMQKNDHVQIGQVLLKKGFMDEAALERELDAFRADQSKYIADKVSIPEGVKNAERLAEIADLTSKMLTRVAGVASKIGEGTVLESEPGEAYSAVSITLSGGLTCDYVIMADEDISRAMASSILGFDSSDEDREMVVDGVKEFANMVCGNILGLMARKGKSVEISVPHVLSYDGGYGLVKKQVVVGFDIPTTSGSSKLILAVY